MSPAFLSYQLRIPGICPTSLTPCKRRKSGEEPSLCARGSAVATEHSSPSGKSRGCARQSARPQPALRNVGNGAGQGETGHWGHQGEGRQGRAGGEGRGLGGGHWGLWVRTQARGCSLSSGAGPELVSPCGAWAQRLRVTMGPLRTLNPGPARAAEIISVRGMKRKLCHEGGRSSRLGNEGPLWLVHRARKRPQSAIKL